MRRFTISSMPATVSKAHLPSFSLLTSGNGNGQTSEPMLMMRSSPSPSTVTSLAAASFISPIRSAMPSAAFTLSASSPSSFEICTMIAGCHRRLEGGNALVGRGEERRLGADEGLQPVRQRMGRRCKGHGPENERRAEQCRGNQMLDGHGHVLSSRCFAQRRPRPPPPRPPPPPLGMGRFFIFWPPPPPPLGRL